MHANRNKSIWNYFYIAWIGLVCIILLILNFEIVRMAVQGIPALSNYLRAAEMIQFFLPIVMIFLEFRIYDFLIDRADRAAELEPPQGEDRI